MRIEDILQRALGTDLLGIHANRLKLVFAATCALLRCSKATLTSIGRAIATGTTHKHGIKRADRLLGNRHVHAERRQMFAAIARKVIAPRSRPVVIVDWTDFSSKMWSLVAAVTFEGRAVTIYSETHPVSRYLKPAVHRAFLQKLRQVVPEGCTPIILTDAGFRTPWIREVSRLGWDYVCRLRGLTRLREEGRIGWSKLIHLFERMGKGPRDFGTYELGLKALFKTRVVGFSRRRRSENWREKWGKLTRSKLHKQQRSAREPWILATSLKSSPNKIIALYRRRMQIEETFRDIKSRNLGLSMDHARTRRASRVNVLMLLASLAHLLSIVAGFVAEACKLDRRFQANTIRKRRVLSVSKLGRLLAHDGPHRWCSVEVASAWRRLTEQTNLSCHPEL